jgi:hypothetical protein
MHYRTGRQIRGLAAVCMLALLVSAGCGAKKDMLKDGGVSLKYAMPEGNTLIYRYLNGFSQAMNIMGDTFNVSGDDSWRFSVRSTGETDGDYRLELTIDSAASKIVSPQGDFLPNLKDIEGKSFDLSLSRHGKETGALTAPPIEYEVYPGQKQNAITVFQAFFPDLPTRPVKVGDTWLSVDTVYDNAGAGEMTIILNSHNRFDGFDVINGLRCARIAATVEGTISGSRNEDGVDLVSNLAVTGQEVWHFAYLKGAFVKSVSSGTAEGNVVGSGPREITIPIKREYNITAELIE